MPLIYLLFLDLPFSRFTKHGKTKKNRSIFSVFQIFLTSIISIFFSNSTFFNFNYVTFCFSKMEKFLNFNRIMFVFLFVSDLWISRPHITHIHGNCNILELDKREDRIKITVAVSKKDERG
jgi:hypothetical protein